MESSCVASCTGIIDNASHCSLAMDPTNTVTPAAVTASPVAVAAPAQVALPRPVVWTALAIAVALPVILLTTLIIVMIATQYNILNWME